MRPTINYDIGVELHTLIEGLRTVINQKLLQKANLATPRVEKLRKPKQPASGKVGI